MEAGGGGEGRGLILSFSFCPRTKQREHLGHPFLHFNDPKMETFCSFAPSPLFWWGEGGLLFLFILSKIAIFYKISGISGPPLPPFHWCQNGECLLLRAFIMASGEIRLLFLFMLPKIVASHPGGSRKISRRYSNRDKLWPDGPFGLYRRYQLLLLHRNPNI